MVIKKEPAQQMAGKTKKDTFIVNNYSLNVNRKIQILYKNEEDTHDQSINYEL